MRRRAAGAPLLLTMVMIPGKYEKSMTKRGFFFELFRNSLKTAPFAEGEAPISICVPLRKKCCVPAPCGGGNTSLSKKSFRQAGEDFETLKKFQNLMIKNERHPSWVSFVTIFLPVSLRSTTFSTVSCSRPLRGREHERDRESAKGAAAHQGSSFAPDRMAAMSSAAAFRSRCTPENRPIWARF